MTSVFRKYFSAFLSIVSSVVAAASIGLVFRDTGIFGRDTELIAIAFGVAATGMAVLSAVFMRDILRKQSLRRNARRVFVIYARKDLPTAKELARLLKEHGFEPWLDVEQIEAGQIWKDAVNEALDESSIAIVLCSENLEKSATSMEELNRAISKMESNDRMTSPIIPVKIDQAEVPKVISHIQYVDMATEDASQFLIRSLEGARRRVLGSQEVSQPTSA